MAAMRAAGWAMVGAAATTVLAMSHHPTSAHAGGLNQLVHGVMIAVAGVSAFGFLHWSRLRGLDRPEVSAGLVAYLIALFGHIGAATISGFVMTALVHGGGASGDARVFAWEANQALSQVGVFAGGAAFALWSIDLLRRGDVAERAVGGLGLLAGLLPPVLLATGVIRMDVQGALIVYSAQMGWMALVGLLMLRSARTATA